MTSRITQANLPKGRCVIREQDLQKAETPGLTSADTIPESCFADYGFWVTEGVNMCIPLVCSNQMTSRWGQSMT
jgi:hypothetical protein